LDYEHVSRTECARNLRFYCIKFYIWSIASYSVETWTLGEVDHKHLESFETWCWRRTEISWTDHVRNEEFLLRVKKQRNILHEISKRKANWIGHILRINKTLIYKGVLIPVWTYGIELWGCAFSSNMEILQRYQSKIPRLITQAPWYVTNQILHRNLGIAPVREIPKDKAKAHRKTVGSPKPTHGISDNLTTNPETET
jgi:hypothetical protein